MKVADKLKYCVLINMMLFIFVLIAIFVGGAKETYYYKFGPNEDLYVLSIKIDTVRKYLCLQLFLMILEFGKVFTNEIASPILGFNIYNPDKKVITEFTKFELQLYANSMWLINSLTNCLFVLITISQFDIAILRVFYSECTSILTIRLLLNEKTFTMDGNNSYISLEEGDNDYDNKYDLPLEKCEGIIIGGLIVERNN